MSCDAHEAETRSCGCIRQVGSRWCSRKGTDAYRGKHLAGVLHSQIIFQLGQPPKVVVGVISLSKPLATTCFLANL